MSFKLAIKVGSPTLNLAAFLLILGAATHSGEKKPLQIEIQQAAWGVLLCDDFGGGTIDRNLWSISVEDPGIQVTVQEGELCIRGRSAKILKTELYQKEVKLWRFAGLTSRPFPQTDVSLAVRVKMPSGISGEPGLHGVSVHLCGVSPDTYPEVLFGKVEGKATEEILHEFAKGTPDDVPYPDARGWFLGIINQAQGDYRYLISGQPFPEQGDERKSFHDVLVEYDGQKRLARAYLKIRERYQPLGKEEPLFRGLTQVELKLIDVTPLYGAYREAHFDDCRLYPNPRHNQVRFVAVDDYPVQFPAATGAPYGLLYRGPRMRVALYTSDGVNKISEGYTDGEGMVNLPVDTPLWVAFPAAAMVRFYLNDSEVARSFIKSQGVKGLYPGDVWVFDTSQILREKT
jgi:hypothetical protein